MSAMPNPIYAGQLPPQNPTGTSIAVPGSAPSSSGQNTLMPAIGTSTSAPTSKNPFAAGFGANTGGYTSGSLTGAVPGAPTTNVGQAGQSPVGGMSSMSPTDLSRLFNSLRNTYGDGMAHTILNFLTSGAGFNQQAINNMLAALQPGIERGTESIVEQFSTTGNRFGSGAQIGLADYMSQVQLNEGQIEAKMYEDAVNRYMDVMMGTSGPVGQEKQNSPSAWDYAQQAANFGATLASAGKGMKGMMGGGGGAVPGAVGSGGAAVTSSPWNYDISGGAAAA